MTLFILRPVCSSFLRFGRPHVRRYAWLLWGTLRSDGALRCGHRGAGHRQRHPCWSSHLSHAHPTATRSRQRVPCLRRTIWIGSRAMSPSAPLSAAPVQSLSPSAAPARLFSRDFLLLCLSSFLFSLSMFLLFAALPVFVVPELHGANSQVGLIMGAFALSAVIARPGSGRLVDVWSRKTGLRLGALIYCLAPALYTQASTVAIMLGLRFFHGLGVALYTTAGSVLAVDPFRPPPP